MPNCSRPIWLSSSAIATPAMVSSWASSSSAVIVFLSEAQSIQTPVFSSRENRMEAGSTLKLMPIKVSGS